MADSRKTVQIKSDPIGDVRIADEVVAIIAGLAATEVDASVPWRETSQTKLSASSA